jgi:beta-phosphoglucomutase-like phosphatase (HAD superfamily)
METPLSLVIFDCDGVLVDSEMTINRVLAREITALGWSLTPAQSQAIFLGLSLSDIMPMVEGRTGKKLPSNWPAQISELTAAALADGVPLIPGAIAVLQELSAMGLPWRVASNSSRQELSIKFARTGLDKIVNPAHVHAATDMIAIGKRGKPAPDLFLAAAEADGSGWHGMPRLYAAWQR